MKLDPKKVKELILIYSELCEDYQEELMKKAFTLQLMQSQRNLIEKEGKKFKSDEMLQEEVERRSVQGAKDAKDLLDIINEVSATDKAAIYMMINQLAGKSNVVQESDVTITINQRDVSMKDYLEMYLSDADYDEAKTKVKVFLDKAHMENK